eukprot:142079-Pyramimonas_sp.AAC.1
MVTSWVAPPIKCAIGCAMYGLHHVAPQAAPRVAGCAIHEFRHGLRAIHGMYHRLCPRRPNIKRPAMGCAIG